MSLSVPHIHSEIRAAARKSGLAFDIYGFQGDETDVIFENGKLKTCSSSEEKSLNIRALKGGRAGISRTKDFSQEGLRACFQQAAAALRLTDKKEAGLQASGQPYKTFKEPSSPKGFSMEEKIQKASLMDSIVSRHDKRLQPTSSFVVENSRLYFFANSEGALCRFRSQQAVAGSFVLAKDGAYRSQDGVFFRKRSLQEIDFEKMAQESSRRALKKLRYIVPRTRKYPVVFKSGAAADFVAQLSRLLNGQAVFEGLSPLKRESLGQRFFSKNFSLYDDPFAAWGVYGQPFDGEGFASERTCLIEEGSIKNYLTSSFFARALKAPHTKKAAWREDKGGLSAAPFHLEMPGGSHAFEELVGEFPETVVIDRLNGLHSGFNPISGDFSIESEGFLYRGGAAAPAAASSGATAPIDTAPQPICQFTVSGNILSAFAHILKVGNDSRADDGRCQAPSFLIEELSIAGK